MINKQDAPYENQEDDSFKLEEFGYILLAHWHWIILSVAIALGVAVLKILRTTPTYVQSTSLLIKSDDCILNYKCKLKTDYTLYLYMTIRPLAC